MGVTGRDVHVNRALSNVVIAYRPEGMIADMVAPIVPVMKQADAYNIWSAADAFRIEDSTRAPGTEANVITRNVSSGTFFCKNYALKDRIPLEDLENKDEGFRFMERQGRAEFITDKLFLDWEYRLASQVTSTSNVGSSSAVSSSWADDYTNSDPILDLNTAISNVQDMTGYRPNSMVFGHQAWRHFRENSGVIDRIYGNAKEGPARVVTIEGAKALFELDRVVVGGAYRNTADEGQSSSLSAIWADHVLVYYAPMMPRADKPSFMYSFRWNKIMNMEARVYPLPRAHAEEVEVGYYQDEVITASDLSFLVTNCTSST